MDEIVNEILAPVQCFLMDHGFMFLAANAKLILLLIICSGAIPTTLNVGILMYSRYKEWRLIADLHPEYSRKTIKDAVNIYVPTKGQKDSPINELEPKQERSITVTNRLVDILIDDGFDPDSESMFYLILGDSGMGKTTFMINLYWKYRRKIPKRSFDIRLLPIRSEVDGKIASIVNKSNTILLLDALDEDEMAIVDIQSRFNQLIELCKGFRKVVISSRTQFFSLESHIPKQVKVRRNDRYGNAFHDLHTFYISPFNTNDIRSFLNQKFGRYNPFKIKLKAKAWKIVYKSPNLMVRPMLLSYVDDFVMDPNIQKYEYVHNIYAVMIGKWIERESKWLPVDEQDQYGKNLLRFSMDVAMRIYANLADNGFYINDHEMVDAAKINGINKSKLELQGRSLLNLNTGGRIKFAHKSILEYFVALEAFENKNIGISQHGAFVPIPGTFGDGMDMANIFLKEMALESTLNLGKTEIQLINLQLIREHFFPEYNRVLASIGDLRKMFEVGIEEQRNTIEILTIDLEQRRSEQRLSNGNLPSNILPENTQLKLTSDIKWLEHSIEAKRTFDFNAFSLVSKKIVAYHYLFHNSDYFENLIDERVGGLDRINKFETYLGKIRKKTEVIYFGVPKSI